jgi:hypothetical protein
MAYGAIGAVTSSLGLVIVFALYALYLLAVGTVTKAGIKYSQWFGLCLWCALPVLLGLLATIVFLLTNDVRFMAQEALNPLSFGNLLSIEAEGAPTFQRVLLSLDPTSIWSLVLSILGYQAFTRRSIVHAALVVLAPILLIVLVTAL